MPAPASYPPVVGEKGVVTTHALSMAIGRQIAHGAVDACRKMGFHTNITVLDASGALKAFLRDDMTGPHTISLSKDKAYTAITLAQPLRQFRRLRHGAQFHPGFAHDQHPGVVGVAGGVPIKYRGEVIGGVGSSGAVGGDKDELCSQAGYRCCGRPAPITASSSRRRAAPPK